MPETYNDLSPLEIYSQATQDSNILRNEKVWGCPVYVLDPRLQDDKNPQMRS